MSEVPVNIEAVARHYHGEPNSRLSKTNELRFGTHGSLSVDLVKNTWFSFEDDVGGGVADLVRREEGDNANVAKILQEKFGAERYRQIDLEEAIARAKGDNWFAPLTSDDLPLDSPHDQFLGWSAADRANTAQSRFNVHTLDGLAQLPEPEFLIDGLLIEGTDVVLYGPSEAMKTGTAISWAVAVSHDQDWLGRDTNDGYVIFVAGEGGALLRSRIASALEHDGLQDSGRLLVISDNADLFSGEADVEALMQVAQHVQPVLWIWDTISQHSGSATENSDDMKSVLRNMRKIARVSNAANLILAHPGKDTGRGLRGWSGQKNNVDTVILQDRVGDRISLHCEKMKDAAPFETINLGFEIVDGAPVITAGSGSAPSADSRKLTGNNRKAHQYFCNLLVDAESDDIRGPSCTEAQWRDACAARGLGGTDNADSQSKAFRRAYNALLDVTFYVRNGRLYLADKTDLSGEFS